jgi:hypothetical protein
MREEGRAKGENDSGEEEPRALSACGLTHDCSIEEGLVTDSMNHHGQEKPKKPIEKRIAFSAVVGFLAICYIIITSPRLHWRRHRGGRNRRHRNDLDLHDHARPVLKRRARAEQAWTEQEHET